MILGRVVGTVVSTQKDEKLEGFKFFVVRNLSLDLKEMETFVVAADAIGAGMGEVVLYASGSSARMTALTKDKPVDAVVMAIVDEVEIGGKKVFEKVPGPPAG